MFSKVGVLKRHSGELVPVFYREVDGEKQLFFNDDPYGGIYVSGYSDLPIAELPGDDLLEELCNTLADGLRGSDCVGLIWLSNDQMIAIKDIDDFTSTLIPKKLGSGDEEEYNGFVGVCDLEEDLPDSDDILNFLMFE